MAKRMGFFLFALFTVVSCNPGARITRDEVIVVAPGQKSDVAFGIRNGKVDGTFSVTGGSGDLTFSVIGPTAQTILPEKTAQGGTNFAFEARDEGFYRFIFARGPAPPRYMTMRDDKTVKLKVRYSPFPEDIPPAKVLP